MYNVTASYKKLGLVAVLALALTGCALPGLHLNDYGDSSPWYGGTDARYAGDKQGQAPPDYQPEVVQITPALVNKLRSQKDDNTVVKSLERPAGQAYSAYKVGPGDLLGVIVYGHPDLTNPAGTTQSTDSSGRLVSADGEVFFPFVGSMHVAGLTTKQIREKLTDGLKRVIREPQIDVRVLKFRSKFVYVAGDVNRPCAVPLEDVPLTVIQALDACQSLVSENEPFGVQAIRLVRAGQTYPLDLNAIYRSGNPLVLQAGDRLIIDDSFSRVFVVGEFDKQVTAPYSAGGLTLADGIAAGGGLNLSTADATNIYVIRGFVDTQTGPDGKVQTNIRPKIFHLDASSIDALILADTFQLKPRDVVYAAPASLVNFNRALALIAPSINLLFQSALVYDRARR